MKAFFDTAVQPMNDKADQVGRSTMQNEGMINVQIARIDDALSQLARLESEWIDRQNILEDVTDAEFHRWVNGSGHNQLDLEWSLKQLYYLMNAKLVEGAKDIVRAEASKGNIRGARAWKRVQVSAAGLTQNGRSYSWS